MRFLRTVFLTLVAAALGAVLGRLVAGLRRESQGEEAMAFDAGALTPSPQELVPGIVAAMRVTDAPWSALHVPPWLAAFVVNFSMAALGRELGPLLKTFGFGGSDEHDPPARPADIWTVEARPAAPPPPAPAPYSSAPTPPPAAPTPPTAQTPPSPTPPPAPVPEAPRPAPGPASPGGFTSTSSAPPPNTPPPANGDHPGFQPFRS